MFQRPAKEIMQNRKFHLLKGVRRYDAIIHQWFGLFGSVFFFETKRRVASLLLLLLLLLLFSVSVFFPIVFLEPRSCQPWSAIHRSTDRSSRCLFQRKETAKKRKKTKPETR